MPILRIIFAIFSICVGALIGVSISTKYKDRVRQLEKCDMFLLRIQTFLKCEQTPTRDLFKKLSESDNLSELIFLKKTSEMLMNDINFPTIWENALKSSKYDMALKEEDYVALRSLSDIIGAYDADSQLSSIEVAREIIKSNLSSAKDEMLTNGKLARSLGVLGGISIGILII